MPIITRRIRFHRTGSKLYELKNYNVVKRFTFIIATGAMGSSFLYALLKILYQIITSSRPLVICICTCLDHKIGSLTFTHLGVKSLPEITNRISPTEAR